ncbi:NrfD/PsrC family molybdoenzyme membrane anchor subunit [Thermanaeromonas sp. C210]|uniref:NrfD/PsrC family molybdoenzyme membrane anchor subunit n=1 Tax=Thermanaeromonas sp. C210 TaxID=2731925 RepID=UPI00155D0410|nr:Ni/Fe-hydrogenase cytochrome b subunit [Thermanaeromonas sp. C210]GFN22153.1 Ni/Fe-hydrogenase cytochrome b subunit [Thermanaeromonas sp. C210]
MTKGWSFRITPYRVALMALAAGALAIILLRLAKGLGATTNLNDHWPWGLWITIDVFVGVALAGGGFTTAFLVHILHRSEYKPIARAALLTSLIGYLLVLAGLFLDVGRWYNAWRPFFFWGYHSVLFEVFWCVSLYTLVQLLEFGEVAFERIRVPSLKTRLEKLLPFLYILGIVLPTLHQSSLGGLWVVTAGRLHPLWWSMALPIFFLLSAAFVGPAMVTIESYLSARAYNREPEFDVLESLSRIGRWLLLGYLLLKSIDLSYRGQWGALLEGSLESHLFMVEMVGGVLVPLIMYFTPSIRKTSFGLVAASALVVAGVVLNRINVSITGMLRANGGSYFPSWMELLVTLGLISLGVLVYCFVVENFAILTAREKGTEETAVPTPEARLESLVSTQGS